MHLVQKFSSSSVVRKAPNKKKISRDKKSKNLGKINFFTFSFIVS